MDSQERKTVIRYPQSAFRLQSEIDDCRNRWLEWSQRQVTYKQGEERPCHIFTIENEPLKMTLWGTYELPE